MEPEGSLMSSQVRATCFYSNPDQSTPCPPPTSWRAILILSSYLRPCLPSGLFPSGLPTKTLCTALPSPIRATFPAHLILDLFTQIIFGEEYRLCSSSCSFLHSPVTSSLLGPNILPSTLFSNTLGLRFSLIVSYQFPHTYKTTGIIIVLYILMWSCYMHS
jgi:hypothetical protein